MDDWPSVQNRLDEPEVFVAGAEDGLAVGAEPAVNQGGVDGAEVGGEAQVARVQVGQAGVLAVEAALDRLADDEHLGGGAVVGAAARVLVDAPPELGEADRDHLVGLAHLVQVALEGGEAVRKLGQELDVTPGLVGVRVERAAAEGDVEDARAEVGGDQGTRLLGGRCRTRRWGT